MNAALDSQQDLIAKNAHKHELLVELQAQVSQLKDELSEKSVCGTSTYSSLSLSSFVACLFCLLPRALVRHTDTHTDSCQALPDCATLCPATAQIEASGLEERLNRARHEAEEAKLRGSEAERTLDSQLRFVCAVVSMHQF